MYICLHLCVCIYAHAYINTYTQSAHLSHGVGVVTAGALTLANTYLY